jgi:hypothetical protein
MIPRNIGRGGKRQGAGRPKTDNEPRTIRVTDAEFKQVKEFIEKLRGGLQ